MTGTLLASKFKVPAIYLIFVGAILQLVGYAFLGTLGISVQVEKAVYGYLVLCGFGCGMSFTMAYITVPFTVDNCDKAVGMAAANQFRTMGSVMGLAIATSIFNGYMLSHLAGLGIDHSVTDLITGQQTVGYADLYPSILSSPGDPASWWNLTTLNPDVESLFASPLSVLQPETSNSDTTGNSPFFSSSGISSTRSGFDSNDATVLLPEDTFVAIDNVSEPAEQMSLSEIQSSLPSDVFNFQDLLSDSPGCCLLRALGLLKLLFRNTAATCTCSSGEGYSYTSCQVPTITSVIAENEKTIGVISKMLQCPCSLDGYLLAIMSLIVFKILGWYAAAAKKTPETSMAEESQGTNKRKLDARRPSSCHSEQVIQIAAVVGSYCLEGEDQERMAAQLVLSQLHLVQRLVNELSIRLKAADDQEVARGGHLASPISATMLSQLEVDLRKRLRALSLEIVDILHRE